MDTKLYNEFMGLKQKILSKKFERMNESQRQAIFNVVGPVLILAGAGSGKTTVLVHRIVNMIKYGIGYQSAYIPEYVSEKEMDILRDCEQGKPVNESLIDDLISYKPIKAWNILAITFTNKAAGELKERLYNVLGEAALDIQASTFHSACMKILRSNIDKLSYKKNFTVFDSDDSQRLVKECMKALQVDEKAFNPRMIQSAISSAKDKLKNPELLLGEAKENPKDITVAKVYGAYQKELKASNVLDFDDIIFLTVKLLKDNLDLLEHYQNRFKYIMVDEYQDTNHAQYMLISMLAKGHRNLCVVGDDDQSIYKFRGANIENILNFEKQFENALIIRLEQNYRSTTTILEAANKLIANNSERKGKNLWTDNGDGESIQVYRANDETEESRYVADIILSNVKNGDKFSDHAILYRMNAQSNVIEKSLVKYGIPYRILGGLRFYERKEIKDIIAYLCVVNNPEDSLHLRRIINEPKRGIGDTTLNTVSEIAAEQGCSMFEIMNDAHSYMKLQKKAHYLVEFTTMIKNLNDSLSAKSLDEIFDMLLEATDYKKVYDANTIDGRGRIENIDELKSNIVNYIQDNEEPTLAEFLEEISLYTDLDNLDASLDTVVMMTMHSSKGLEFPYVFICGMEEGIFPGTQSMRSPKEIEEERRLAYVGITRAKKRLYLSNSAQRLMFGQTNRNRPSRFLAEIPAELCVTEDQSLKVNKMGVAGNKAAVVRKGVVATSTTIGVNATMGAISSVKFDIKAGDNVSHKVFGNGQVRSVTSMANDHLVEVDFDKVGTKKIMANFARLTKSSQE